MALGRFLRYRFWWNDFLWPYKRAWSSVFCQGKLKYEYSSSGLDAAMNNDLLLVKRSVAVAGRFAAFIEHAFPRQSARQAKL
jgi:hypothetical protein